MKSYTIEELNNLDKSALSAIILTMQEQIVHMSNQLDKLTELIAVMNQRQFGKKSESTVDNNQLSLFDSYDAFNEAENKADNSPEPEIEETIVNSYKRSKKVGKRDEDLNGLPTRIINHALSEEELNELFPNGYKELPEEVYKRLSIIPKTYIVDEHHVHVYVPKDNDGRIVRAKRPTDLFRNSIATSALVAAIIAAKYNLHMPLDRQAKEFQEAGINLNTNTLANWVIKSSELYISQLYDYLHELLYTEHVIHADESPFKVINDGRESSTNSYMWVYRSNPVCSSHPIILYDYEQTRKADHPREFLKDFSGTVITDGYQVYHTINDEREDLSVAGCWVHAKRKFAEIIKSLGKDNARSTIANEAVKKISYIFHLDNQFESLTSKERTIKRQDKLKPYVDDYFAWVKETIPHVTNGGNTYKALQYSLNQEKYLRVFLDNGDVPMDNNAAEQAIRPFTIGRKNWVITNSVHGAEASSVLYSIVETAKANNLNVLEYLELLLTEIPKHQDETNRSFLEKLLPWSPEVQKKCYVKKVIQ